MSTISVFYRLTQLYYAIIPRVKREEMSWLQEVLSEKELTLFRKQFLIEQRHALNVSQEILAQKSAIEQALGKTAFNDLLKTALLHDCGKSLIRLRLWQRVFIVIYQYLPNTIKDHISRQRNILSKTMVIYEQHPAWGSHLASKAGLSKEIQLLIENHHSPRNEIEKIIFEADSKH